MDLQEVLDKLEESIEEKNWDLVQEFWRINRMNLDNPYDDYDGEDWMTRFRHVLFDNKEEIE